MLNLSGVVTNVDGSAAEGVFVFLILENGNQDNFVVTNNDGSYAFNITLEDDNEQGCFELFIINCNFEGIFMSECYNPENLEFIIDFVYCANGTDTCNAFIISDFTGTSLILSVFSFGPPYTYLWSDGSAQERLELPGDIEGEYCVEVTDAQGCVAEACIDLTPLDPCFVHIFEEYNFNSVLLFAEGYGQMEDLSYVWSTGETGEIITVTALDEYCVTLTDGLGGESIDCRYIEIDSSWTQDCFAYIYSSLEDDVTETLFVESFGVAPFTYEWTLGDSIISTSDFIIPGISRVYCVTVTDAEGCVFTTCYDYFIWEECGVWIGCDPTATGVQLWAFGYGE